MTTTAPPPIGHAAVVALRAACLLIACARVAMAQPTPTPTVLPIPGFFRCDIKVADAPASAITTGDFNGDGNPDIAVVDETHSQVVVLLTHRDALAARDCTTSAIKINVRTGPTSIAAGDLDRDNKLDLVVGVQTGVSILRGDGKGGFTPQAPLAAGSGPQTVTVADVDRDGVPDIVVGNSSGTSTGNPNSVSILYGRPEGGFLDATTLPADGPITLMVVRDLNKDSFDDIAAGNGSTGNVTVFIQDRLIPRSFPTHPSFAIGGTAPTAMVAGDFDGDGAPDLAIASGGVSGMLTLFHNQITTNMATPFEKGKSVPTGPFPLAVSADLFNPDFLLDVAVLTQGDAGGPSVPFFLGDGHGGLIDSPGNCSDSGERCSVGLGPRGLAVADIDGDGRSDVVATNQSENPISILLTSMPPPTPTSTRTPASATRTPTPMPTPTAGGDCRSAHAGPGCDVAVCQACVCGLDPPCCATAWDNMCVQDAVGVCGSSCGPTPTPTETPTVTTIPTVTATIPNDCCQCSQGSTCGRASGASCEDGCTLVADASCMATGQCATHTPTPSPPPTSSPTYTPTATPTSTPTATAAMSPTNTSTPSTCCQCLQGPSCGQPFGPTPSCGQGCTPVADASCMDTGQCATHTPVRTIKPTATSTVTPTPSRTPTPTSPATSTPTFTPRCFGSVCVQGEGCGNLAPGRTSRNGLWLLGPALLWWMRRSGRRA